MRTEVPLFGGLKWIWVGVGTVVPLYIQNSAK